MWRQQAVRARPKHARVRTSVSSTNGHLLCWLDRLESPQPPTPFQRPLFGRHWSGRPIDEEEDKGDDEGGNDDTDSCRHGDWVQRKQKIHCFGVKVTLFHRIGSFLREVHLLNVL